MMRLFIIGLGLIFFVFGIIGILTPIPFGIIFLSLSIVLLVPTLPGAAGAVQRARGRSKTFDGAMSAVTRRAPMPYRRILRQTETQDW